MILKKKISNYFIIIDNKLNIIRYYYWKNGPGFDGWLKKKKKKNRTEKNVYKFRDHKKKIMKQNRMRGNI